MDLKTLGELEQLVVLAVVGLAADEAYAVPIRAEIERRTRRRLSRGTVYVTLDRLNTKGILTSWVGDSTAERGGKAKRYYRVTRSGKRLLRSALASIRKMAIGTEFVEDVGI